MRYVLFLFMFIETTAVYAQTNYSSGPSLFTLSLPPEVKPDSTILFRLRAPYAKEVLLLLDGKEQRMLKDAKGIWNLTARGLTPDVYGYNFIVDSFTVTDPSNPLLKQGYNSGAQSLVVVPATPPENWELQDVPHGAVTRHIYRSAIIGDQRDFYVYTPPGYNAKRKEAYPLLFLLHGIGGDARAWTQIGFENIILDNLIAQGKAKPMIVVNTLGYGIPKNMMGNGSFEKFKSALLKEVLPQIENAYNVSMETSERAIAGLSMGGAEAVYAGLNNADKFAWIGAFSSAFVMYRGAGRAGTPVINHQTGITDENIYQYNFPGLDKKINEKIKLLWISCGVSDFLMFSNKDFTKWLSKENINYTNVETPGGHTWMVWRRNLVEFVPLLFR
ncbi:MAG: alpha/beta hydrolase-fold protein [Panacibacter sp.]